MSQHLEVVEAFGSGTLSSGRNRSGEKRYLVFNVLSTDDETDIRTQVETDADETFDGMARRTVQVRPLTNEVWEASVTYSPSELLPPPEYDGWLTTFNTTGQTENVQIAVAQAATSLIDTVQAPAYGKTLNVDGDGVPQGIDIVVPKFEWTETHYLPKATIPGTGNAWLALVHAATGRLNNVAFRGFAIGSVLFTGCSGALRPEQDDWEITFHFVASPGVSVSMPIYSIDGTPKTDTDGVAQYASISKGGHDYLWFVNTRVQDPDSERMVVRAAAAYVAQVYEYVDFDAFVPGATS